MRIKKLLCYLLLCCILSILCGCEKRIMVSGSLNTEYVVCIGEEKIELAQALLIAMTYQSKTQKEYKNAFPGNMWQLEMEEGFSMSEFLISQYVKNELITLAGLNLMADRYGISTVSEEDKSIKDAAKEYFGTLNDEEISYTGATNKTCEKLMRNYYMAEKVINALSKEVSLEVSDEESRVSHFKQIFLSKLEYGSDGEYKKDESGSYVHKDERTVDSLKKRATDMYNEVSNGAGIEAVYKKYEDEDVEFKDVFIYRGAFSPEIEKVAFEMTENQYAFVEDEEGYHILFCKDPYDEDMSENNRKKIIKKRIYDTWHKDYLDFMSKQDVYVDDELFGKIVLKDSELIDNSELFTIYRKHLKI